ncbi:hypothetical protein MKEN_01218500 [Mycena kentingensis (nom. inval.)]|nr:hypothetical protein MKEN_01218500 [Mycena kentingensis (nom. inval.)]
MLLSTQPRISEVLPTVKCSNCGIGVSLEDLGDHKCAPWATSAAPPMPTIQIPPKTDPLNIQKPSMSPGAAASLLPKHLQGRVPGGASPKPPPAAPATRARPPPSQSTSRGPTRVERPTVNTTQAYPSRSSPLARDAGSVRSTSRDPYTSGGDSPIRNRPPVADFARTRSGSSASLGSPIRTRQPYDREPPPPRVDERSVNTQTGGEAGMAGVGRRGFAAAARAALFTAPSPARANPPRNIDTVGYKISTTPPLSTSTGSSNSPGVASYPASPQSPERYSRARSPPRGHMKSSASISSRGAKSIKGSISQSSGSEYGGLAYDSEYEEEDVDLRRRVDETRTPGGVQDRSPNVPRGFGSDPRKAAPPRAPSPQRSVGRGSTRTRDMSPSSDSDYGQDPRLRRNNSARVAEALGLSQSRSASYNGRGGPGQPFSRNRSDSGQSAYSSRDAMQTATDSGKGRMEREMDRMANEKEKELADKPQRRPAGRDELTVDRGVTRGRRSPSPDVRSARSDGAKKPARKPKSCLRCEKEDRRWKVGFNGRGRRFVRSLLEEHVFAKGIFPFWTCSRVVLITFIQCRRCNLIIEKQAVSSSDGQLKGKYHRECFNCHVCHEPFPDKTFYVHNHQPLCAYHYHEANDSLCSSSRCGQPIEGPCAVSYDGARYHPEHMLCEYKHGCKERLDEYWEVDGLMLCERHSTKVRQEEEEADNRGWAKPSTRAMKRQTRFIDLRR